MDVDPEIYHGDIYSSDDEAKTLQKNLRYINNNYFDDKCLLDICEAKFIIGIINQAALDIMECHHALPRYLCAYKRGGKLFEKEFLSADAQQFLSKDNQDFIYYCDLLDLDSDVVHAMIWGVIKKYRKNGKKYELR